MAISIGSASLNLAANIGPLKTGLGSALQSVQSFATGVEVAMAEATGGMSVLLSLITKIIGVISFAALTAQIHETAQAIKETSEQAKAFGVSFNFIQSLQSGGIENASHAFRHLSQEITQATAGNVAAITKLRNIGVNPDQLVPQTAEQRFQTILNAIQRMPDGMEKTAAATQLLGRNATQLLGKFREGVDIFAAMRAEAERFGTTLSKEQIERVEQMNNAWRQFKESVKGVWMQLTAAVAPFFAVIWGGIARIIQIIRMVAQPILSIIGYIGGLIQSVAGWIFGIIDSIMDWFNGLGAVVMPVIEGIKNAFKAAWNAVVDALQGVASAFGYVIDGIKIGIGQILDRAIAPLLRGFSSIVEAITGMLEALSEIPGVGDLIGRAAGALGRFRDNVRDTAQALTETGRAMANTRLGEGADAINRFFNGIRAGRAEAAAAGDDGMGVLRNRVDELNAQLERTRSHFQRTREEVMMIDFRASADFRGNPNREAAERQAQRLQQQIDQTMAQQLTAQVDPTIQLATELERLSGLFQRGALSAQAFAMQNQRVLQQAERALGLGKEFKAEQAIQKGTTQAFEVVARFQMADRGAQTVEQRAEAVRNQMRRLSERQVQIQEQMLRALNPAAVPVVL